MPHKKVKHFRLLMGITPKEMAERIHMSYPTYIRREKNDEQFTFGEILAIVAVLKVTITDLIPENTFLRSAKMV